MLIRSLRPLALGAAVALTLGTGSAAMAATAPTGPPNSGGYGCQYGGHVMKKDATSDSGCWLGGNNGHQKSHSDAMLPGGGNNCGCQTGGLGGGLGGRGGHGTPFHSDAIKIGGQGGNNCGCLYGGNNGQGGVGWTG